MEEINKFYIQPKVLVVEDDKFLSDLLVKKLSREGYDVKSSFDSIGVFKILDQEKQDIILLDLILPGIDGFEILEKIKADKILAVIPVLILSNHGQVEDVERVMYLGASGFLIKANFTLEQILLEVKKFLPSR